MSRRRLYKWILVGAVVVGKAAGFPGPPIARTTRPQQRRIIISSSLFDPDDNSGDNNKEGSNGAPASRKFTGYSPSSSAPNNSVRERMMQREFNLVSVATSPAAFLVQAVSILVVLLFVLYIGATGQLGLNNDYDDGEDFIYNPTTTVIVPSVEFQSSSSPSVFL